MAHNAIIFVSSGSAAHLPEELVIRSVGVHRASSDARVSGFVEWVIGHYSSAVEVGR